MTDEELAQIRAIVREETKAAVEPLRAAQAATDAKVDRLVTAAENIFGGLAKLKTDIENRDAGIRDRVKALEGQRGES